MGVHRHGDPGVDHDDELGDTPMIRSGLCCIVQDESSKFEMIVSQMKARIRR
jgi:hypothetical protein